jgi:N-acylneuraminate cytidylyltransferase
MNILALVPARGGSKRLPGKNIRPLAGKPLLEWTLDAAMGLESVCDVLLSTDDPDIAAAGRKRGALVPWLRPSALATDTASSLDVALHALDWYEKEKGPVDGLLLLQPTSPFRSRNTLVQGIRLFATKGHEAVVGVSPAHPHPYWCFRVVDQRLVPLMVEADLELRSQDLPPAYAVNGAFYLVSPTTLRQSRSFTPPGALPLVMASRREMLDIDDGEDWALAEYYAAHPSP